MVPPPQILSNRLCYSLDPVGVKGDATWKYDVGDTFITGGAPPWLLRRRTHFRTWRVSNLSTSVLSNTSLCLVAVQESCQLLFQSDSLSEAQQRLARGCSISSPLVPVLSIHPSIHLFPCDLRGVAQSCQCRGWLQLSRLPTNCFLAKGQRLVGQHCLLPLFSPRPAPSISKDLVLVSRRRRATTSPPSSYIRLCTAAS